MEPTWVLVQAAGLRTCRRHCNSTSSGTFMYLQDIQFREGCPIQAGGESKRNHLDCVIKAGADAGSLGLWATLSPLPFSTSLVLRLYHFHCLPDYVSLSIVPCFKASTAGNMVLLLWYSIFYA